MPAHDEDLQLDYSTAQRIARLFNEEVDARKDLDGVIADIVLKAKTKSFKSKVIAKLELKEDWISLFDYKLAEDHKNIKRRNAYPLIYAAAEYFDALTNNKDKREKINNRFMDVIKLVYMANKPDWYKTVHLKAVIKYAMDKGAPADYFIQFLPYIKKELKDLLDLALDNSPVAYEVFFNELERELVKPDEYIDLVTTALVGKQFNRLNALLTDSMLLKHKVSPAERAKWISSLIDAKSSSAKDTKAYDYALFVARLLNQDLDTPVDKLAMDPRWLQKAIENDKFYTCSVLLNHGANPNTLIDGKTAVHLAAAMGRPKVIMLLNQFSADFTLRDGHGKLPVDVAIANNQKMTQKVIEDLSQPPGEVKKDLTDDEVTHLAIRGGGVKGYAYLDTIEEAEKQNLFNLVNIKGVSGASAGAITAALIALNYSASELRAIMGDLDFKAFFDFHSDSTEAEIETFKSIFAQYSSGGISLVPAVWNSFGRAISYFFGGSSINTFAKEKGLAKGDKFLSWIDHRIKEQVAKVVNSNEGQFNEIKERLNSYELCLKEPDTVIEKNKFYVEYSSVGLTYTLLNPQGQQITDTINAWDLKSANIALKAPLTLTQVHDLLEPKFPWILDKTRPKTNIPEYSLITFKDLKDLGFKDLRIVATDTNRNQALWFSAQDTPDAIVADAISASMRYPGMFSPHKYWIRDAHGNRVVHPDYLDVDLGDGGIMDNFPVRAFDKKAGSNQTVYNKNVLGLYLATPEEKKKFEYGITPTVQKFVNGFNYLFGGVLSSLISHQEHIHSESMDTPRTVYISTGDVAAMDFNMNAEQKEMLGANGRQAIHDYISRRVGQKLMSKLSEPTMSLLIRLVGQRIQKIEPDRTVIHLDNLHLDPYQIVTLYANCKDNELSRLQALVNPNNGRDAQGNSALHVAYATKALIEREPNKDLLHRKRSKKIDLAIKRLIQISANEEVTNSLGKTPKLFGKEHDLSSIILPEGFLFTNADKYKSTLRASRMQRNEEEFRKQEKYLQDENLKLRGTVEAFKGQLGKERIEFEQRHQSMEAQHRYQLESLKKENSEALLTLKAAHKTEVDQGLAKIALVRTELEQTKSKHAEEIIGLKKVSSDALSKLQENLEQTKAKHVLEIQQLKDEGALKLQKEQLRHAEEIKGLRKENIEALAKLQLELEKTKAMHASAIELIKTNHVIKLDEKDLKHAEEIKGLKSESSAALIKLQKELDQNKAEHILAIQGLQKEGSEQLESEQNKHAQELKGVKAEGAEALAKLQLELDKTKSEHANEMARLKDGYEDRLKQRVPVVRNALRALTTHRGVLVLELVGLKESDSQYILKTAKIKAIDTLMELENSNRPLQSLQLAQSQRDIISKGFFSRGAKLLERLDEAEHLEAKCFL